MVKQLSRKDLTLVSGGMFSSRSTCRQYSRIEKNLDFTKSMVLFKLFYSDEIVLLNEETFYKLLENSKYPLELVSLDCEGMKKLIRANWGIPKPEIPQIIITPPSET